MVWNLFPLKGDFSFGKRQKLQGTKSGSAGSWVIWVIWCYTKKLCAMDTLSWWSCQSPVAHSCGLLNHPNSFCGGMFKLITKFDEDSLLSSVILNMMTTQYTCSLHGIYRSHWLAQWSCHHSSPLSLAASMSHKPFSLYYQWLDFFQQTSYFGYPDKLGIGHFLGQTFLTGGI